MKEPFRTIWFTLIQHNFPTGKWTYDVMISKTADAIYIGDDANHCTVLKGHAGYHHTEGGTTGDQHDAYTTLESMIERAEYNPTFYTQKIVTALTWLKNNKSSI